MLKRGLLLASPLYLQAATPKRKVWQWPLRSLKFRIHGKDCIFERVDKSDSPDPALLLIAKSAKCCDRKND